MIRRNRQLARFVASWAAYAAMLIAELEDAGEAEAAVGLARALDALPKLWKATFDADVLGAAFSEAAPLVFGPANDDGADHGPCWR